MKLSTVKVEQIDADKNVIIDYGEVLSPEEINNIIVDSFPNTHLVEKQIIGRYDKTNFCIYTKNINYLGNPHPIFKKRIQIPSNFKNIYDSNNSINIKTVMIGIYKYKNNILFCDFNTSKYVTNNLNNSSAHIFTIDLKNGLEQGFFQKRDLRGNLITVFTKDRVEDYYKFKFENTEIESKFEICNTFDAFFESISKNWLGKECYESMIQANYNNKFQSEWAGFYLEFLLNNYIVEHHIQDIISYEQNKKRNDVDLDLHFSKINSYGDLKTHSDSSNGVLGNDLETVKSLILDGNIYYIVCNHATEMDKNHDFEVTKYWNTVQHKSDIMSYSNKMKYKIELKSFYILEINKYNFRYVDIYNQGRNSDGNPRNPKISISSKNIDNFLIHAVYFDEKD